MAKKKTDLFSTPNPKGYMGKIVGMMAWRVALVSFVGSLLVQDPGLFGLYFIWLPQIVFCAGSVTRKRKKEIENEAKRYRVETRDNEALHEMGSLESMDPDEEFYLFVDESVQGPYTAKQIKQLLGEGSVTKETLCCLSGSQEWAALGSIELIFGKAFPKNITARKKAGNESANIVAPRSRQILDQSMKNGTLKNACIFLVALLLIPAATEWLISKWPKTRAKEFSKPLSTIAKPSFTAKEIWERVSPSVVLIETKRVNGKVQNGSGFVIHRSGKFNSGDIQNLSEVDLTDFIYGYSTETPRNVIVTNRHVVEGAREILIKHKNGQTGIVSQHRVSLNSDIAILDIPSGLQLPALDPQSNPPSVGETVYALGYPLGLEKAITNGIINAKDEGALMFNAPISSGCSGGPLVDTSGRVIGIVTQGSKSSNQDIIQNLNVAIEVGVLEQFLAIRGPLLSFIEGWTVLAEEENWFIGQEEALGVRDLYEFLNAQFMSELFIQAGEVSPEKQIKGRRLLAEGKRELETKFGPLEKAVDRAIGFLETAPARMEIWPGYFKRLDGDPLFEDFLKDDRPKASGKRTPISSQDFTPALDASIKITKARYIDYIQALRFCRTVLNIPASQWNGLGLSLDAIDKKKLARDSWAIDEKQYPQGDLEKQFERFFLGLKEPPMPLERALTMSSREWAKYRGGFERTILNMFQEMAIEHLQKGQVERGIELLQQEVAFRRYPSYRLLAHLKAASGAFEEAYALYEKAYIESSKELNPFSLERKTNWGAFSTIVETTSGCSDSLWSYPKSVQETMKKWERFALSKGLVSQVEKVHFSVMLNHPTFKSLSKFEKARIVKTYENKMMMGSDKNELDQFNKVRFEDESLSGLY